MPRPRRTVAPVTDTTTARWLDRALRNTNLHKTLQDAVSRKLPKSAAAGLVEDHIQDGYLRLLEQDALDRHVEDENDPAPSNLRSSDDQVGVQGHPCLWPRACPP